MSRLYRYTENGWMTPTDFYTAVRDNPKVKPRLKKKAELILNNWAYLPELGMQHLNNALSEKPCFNTWRRLNREAGRLTLGIHYHFTYVGGLKEAFRKSMEYYKFSYS